MWIATCCFYRMMTKILSGVAVALVVAGVIASLSDVRRYIRISTM